MKKHEVLETEVTVREQLVRTVEKTGEHLISEEHYASEDILEKNNSLQEAWKTLLATIEERRKKLDDSLQVQKVRGLSKCNVNLVIPIVLEIRKIGKSDSTVLLMNSRFFFM
jgi:hypothetical protein